MLHQLVKAELHDLSLLFVRIALVWELAVVKAVGHHRVKLSQELTLKHAIWTEYFTELFLKQVGLKCFAVLFCQPLQSLLFLLDRARIKVDVVLEHDLPEGLWTLKKLAVSKEGDLALLAEDLVAVLALHWHVGEPIALEAHDFFYKLLL